MDIKDAQDKVDETIKQYGNYWEPLSMMARLTEEVGELARAMNIKYGGKKSKFEGDGREIEKELADVLYTVLAIGNSQGIDLAEELKQKMEGSHKKALEVYSKPENDLEVVEEDTEDEVFEDGGQKTVYLIHRWGGDSSSDLWYVWLKEECEKRGWKIVIPDMPETDNPTIEKWTSKLREIVDEGEEDIYFVGHSIGAQAIMRYLEDANVSAKKTIFVAGWFNLLDSAYEDEDEPEVARPWIEEEIDFEEVRDKAGDVLAIFSSDDDCVSLDDKELFEKRLGAETIVKDDKGHFDDCAKINEIIEFIER